MTATLTFHPLRTYISSVTNDLVVEICLIKKIIGLRCIKSFSHVVIYSACIELV